MFVDLESAIRELAPKLIRYCTARTRQPSLAEEIAQESLSALVDRWRRHGPPDSPEAFVFAVAKRRAARVLLRRRLWLPLRLLDGRTDGSPDPEQRAMERSELDRLLRAIDSLPARVREALLLVVVADLPTREAARVLGISESAVKMRMLRARSRLSSLLEAENGTVRRK
jgi:RNA polymerase sigma-70 factor (ECF subfamily)